MTSLTPVYRAGRSRPARLLLLIIVVAGVTTACATAQSSKEQVSCSWPIPVRDPELCHTVQVDGATYRYALVTSPGSAVRDLVIADPGGPGKSVLAKEGVTGLASAIETRDSTIVVLEEPWVTRPAEPSARCREASTEYLTAVRGPLPIAIEPINAVKHACADTEYGWTPDRYRAVVAAIAKSSHASVTGFFGGSFAAYRLSWLLDGDRFPITRAALANPLLPELSPEEVFDHQAAAVTTIGEPISGEVLAAAESQLGYAKRTALPSLAGMTPAQLTSLADAHIGRYGDGKLSTSRIAYFQELCAAGFSLRSSIEGSPVYRYLGTVHAGCPGVAGPRPGVLSRVTNLCLVVSNEDATIPHQRVEGLVRPQYRTTAPHSDFSGLRLCADTFRR